MNVGIIGSGGRENSICFALSKSKKVDKIFCMPGNGGTEIISKNLNININNFQEIKNSVLKNKIDLLIIGPEKPLVDGLVDFFKDTNVKVFGPNKAASQLEGSKIFTKNLCQKYNIPTANFGIFKNPLESKKFIDGASFPIVIKADGLASGKGVYISEDKQEAYDAIDEIFNGKFGKAENLLIEEFLEGEEMSYFIVTDGKSIKPFETAQDHKRINEGDKGQNTGGMGAYSPSRLINKNLESKIIEKIINPTLDGLRDMGIEYKGFLYAGLMIKNEEPFLIEYNVRMGDPECQTILPKLKTDLIEVLLSCCNKTLGELEIEWSKKKSLSIVLCSKGYPNEYKKNVIIKNIENILLDQNNLCFHAGTILDNNKILAVGGRVLNFVSIAESFLKARKDIINNIKTLNWENGFYRSDIGHRVIDE
jgi:phosphoribosylamine--glycine ligase|tara:strand:+ start:19 stop:1284 length:1266 start_codon:yes stop_codon:yes gene_type:complete